jgi:DeoR/GlpR family transcriptional regulator of sugar metabolism
MWYPGPLTGRSESWAATRAEVFSVNPSKRQEAIVEYLDAVGASLYQDMARLLGVSEMTVRRDIAKLAQRRRVVRTLSGAQTARAPEYLFESHIQQRLAVHRKEKEQIARAALGIIKPRQTVFLDGSTTCLALARQLAKQLRGLTIVTSSALLCMEFGGHAENAHAVFILGGQFDPASATFVGPTAEEAARRYFVDVAFFSTKGLLPEEGTFESAIAAIRIKQIVAEQAARVVLLADHSKFGQRALCKALDISGVHEVVTDAGTAVTDVAQLEQRGIVVRGHRGDHVLSQEVLPYAS